MDMLDVDYALDFVATGGDKALEMVLKSQNFINHLMAYQDAKHRTEKFSLKYYKASDPAKRRKVKPR